MLISSEGFYLITTDSFLGSEAPKRLKRKFLAFENKFEFKIVIYLRRQDDFALSLYNQFIKTHNFWNLYTKNFEEFLQDKRELLDFRCIVERWAKVFGKQNIIVREYKTKFTNSITDFLSIFRIQLNTQFKMTKNTQNRSLTSTGLLIMKKLNEFGINKKTSAINLELVDLINSITSDVYSHGLTSSQRNWMHNQFNADNDLVWRDYSGSN